MTGVSVALLSGALALVIIIATAIFLIQPNFAEWRFGDVPQQELAQPGENLGGPPTRVRIPSISLDASLIPLHMAENGEIEPPEDYQQPGWYEDGTPPGDVGPAVIAGHLDSTDGKAIFYRLHELKPSDVVLVQRGGKWLTFQVVSTGRYPKDKFPTAEVYGPTPDAQLRLITCGGGFDREHMTYSDNVVVFAVAAG